VRVSGVRIEPIARVFEAAPAQGFVAAVRLEPAGLRAFIEVDLPLAALAISRVLGPAGAGQAAAALAASSSGSSAGVPIRPLSEVEKGVLELLFVKLLDSIGRRWGERAELTFHLERLFDAKDPALGDQTGLGQAVVATATIDFEARRESARVILPDAAMAALAPRLETLVPRAGDAMSEVIGRLRDVIGLAQIEVRGTAGRSKLTRAELATLSVGDIIVPDELHLRAGEAGLAGSVDFVIGAGRGETRMRGELTGWDGTMYQVRLTEFLKGSGRREARVSAMDYGEEGGSAVQGESAEAEGAALLEDVPIPLVIELGRLNMTVREIAELRQGEVLELGRSPTEPVALVVEGRVIGGGKLVNVEGEIGVQITSLSR
jgi:type III secretion system YscQ/HrcQ family protein